MKSDNSHAMRHAKLFRNTGLIFILLVSSISPVSAQSDANRDSAIKYIRGVLEQPFLETGGFSAFDCSITSGARPSLPFTCDAEVATGEHYQYLLTPDPAQGLVVDLITEPAAQLEYDFLPAMEAPCRQFLEQFSQADWKGMYAGFNFDLRTLVPFTKVKADLTPIRDLLGATGEPTLESYSLRDGGRDELQYSVPTKNGKAAFRCGLHKMNNEVTILAYLIAPYPGTPLYKSSLEDSATQQLSDLIGDEVSEVEIPYEQLPDVYDGAEGVAVLANGERVRLWVTRSGRADDFSQYDFTFSVFEESTPEELKPEESTPEESKPKESES